MLYQHQLLSTSLKIMRRMGHIQVSQHVVVLCSTPLPLEKKPKNYITKKKVSEENLFFVTIELICILSSFYF